MRIDHFFMDHFNEKFFIIINLLSYHWLVNF